MKKLLLSFSLFIFHFSFLNAQVWDSLGGGIVSSGWPIQAMADYNGNLIVGGFNFDAGPLIVNNIAQWNGSSWDSLGGGISAEGSEGPGAYEAVFSETVYLGNLYVGGSIMLEDDTAIHGLGIAQWNGISWDSVGSGISPFGNVYALQVYNGNLYAAGNFRWAGGITSYSIARWNGINWDSVGTGLGRNYALKYIYGLTVYNGELYAGGSFDTIGNIPAKNIARWNDTNWSPVGTGIDSAVIALTVYNGKLYAGGNLTNAGGVPVKGIASWNGTNWDSVGGGISGGGVAALTQYGSILCAGGVFDSAGNQPANNIAYWDGTSWSAMGNGINGVANETVVGSLCTIGSTLYVGGKFTSAGGIPVNNIAQWTSPLGINGLKGGGGEVKVFPNPSKGIFTIALVGAQNFAPATIEIYNVLGERIFATLKQVQGDKVINLAEQPNGVYFYRVIAEDGSLIGEGKLIIQK